MLIIFVVVINANLKHKEIWKLIKPHNIKRNIKCPLAVTSSTTVTKYKRVKLKEGKRRKGEEGEGRM